MPEFDMPASLPEAYLKARISPTRQNLDAYTILRLAIRKYRTSMPGRPRLILPRGCWARLIRAAERLFPDRLFHTTVDVMELKVCALSPAAATDPATLVTQNPWPYGEVFGVGQRVHVLSAGRVTFTGWICTPSNYDAPYWHAPGHDYVPVGFSSGSTTCTRYRSEDLIPVFDGPPVGQNYLDRVLLIEAAYAIPPSEYARSFVAYSPTSSFSLSTYEEQNRIR